MSMLAGPRRKQKFTLNPRGKHWSEDPNKFGQKMLEKMGWSTGKGLGANEQGMTEHVRVKVKNDQVGIGYQKDKDDQWTGHQDDFNSFLQNLQKEQSGTGTETNNKDKILSGKSLEEMSKQSQKRVHYKKFTRGKDVNKYSAKDLANIFGKKDINENSGKEERVEEEEEVIYDPIGSKDTTAGVLTVKGGNLDDYFKKKSYAGLQKSTSPVKEESDDECEARMGFGYSAKSMSKFYVNDNGDPEEQKSDDESKKYIGFGFTKSKESKSKMKNRMDLNYVYDNPCLDLNILDDSPVPKRVGPKAIDLACSKQITSKKRKSEISYENEGLDLNYSDSHTPKKRKSDYSYENEGMDIGASENHVAIKNECNEDIYEITDESLKTEKRKSKRSKKMKNESVPNGIENPGLDLSALDNYTPEKCIVKDEPLSSVFDDSKRIENLVDTRNKPRIIKCEIISGGFNNLGLDLNYINKLKPKKSIEAQTYENPTVDLDVSDGITPKKNKKIKSVDSLNAFDNPGLDENSLTSENIGKNNDLSNGFCNPGLDLNFPDKPTLNKNKKNEEKRVAFDGLENPGLELETKPTPQKPKRNKGSQALSSGLESPGLDFDCSDKSVKKKFKKNQNLSMISHEFESSGLEVNSFTNEVCNSMSYEVSRTSIGVENNALDLSDENSNKKRVTFNDQLEYNTDVAKKKKKKQKNVVDKYEVVTDKLKKKRKHVESKSTTAFVNEGLDLLIKNEEEIENEINEKKSRKSKRRKDRRKLLLETIEEAPEEEHSNEPPDVENEITDEKEVVVTSELQCEIVSANTVDNEIEVVPVLKSKKKKSKKSLIEIEEDIEVQTIEKKKKKKSVKEEPMEIIEEDSPEKENKCTKKEKRKKTDDKKIKNISPDSDVISLEEFLNEEEDSKTKEIKSKNQSADSEKIETTVPKENNENSYQRFKKTKQVMKSLFMKSPTLIFNGSNINEIKGYGSQFYDH